MPRSSPRRGSARSAVARAGRKKLDVVAHNRDAWDRQVERDNEWTRPVDAGVIARARKGDWSIVLIGYQPVPRDWFPKRLRGLDVLCLASGGSCEVSSLYAGLSIPSSASVK